MRKKLLGISLGLVLACGVLAGCSKESNATDDKVTTESKSTEQSTEESSEVDTEPTTEETSEQVTEESSEEATEQEDTASDKAAEAVEAYKEYIKNNNETFKYSALVYIGDENYPAYIGYDDYYTPEEEMGYFCKLYIYNPNDGVIDICKPNGNKLVGKGKVYYNEKTKIFRFSESEGFSALYGKVTSEGFEVCCIKTTRNYDDVRYYDIKTYDDNYNEINKIEKIAEEEISSYIDMYGNNDDFIRFENPYETIEEALANLK